MKVDHNKTIANQGAHLHHTCPTITASFEPTHTRETSEVVKSRHFEQKIIGERFRPVRWSQSYFSWAVSLEYSKSDQLDTIERVWLCRVICNKIESHRRSTVNNTELHSKEVLHHCDRKWGFFYAISRALCSIPMLQM